MSTENEKKYEWSDVEDYSLCINAMHAVYAELAAVAERLETLGITERVPEQIRLLDTIESIKTSAAALEEAQANGMHRIATFKDLMNEQERKEHEYS